MSIEADFETDHIIRVGRSHVVFSGGKWWLLTEHGSVPYGRRSEALGEALDRELDR